jgi:hypothetical protein
MNNIRSMCIDKVLHDPIRLYPDLISLIDSYIWYPNLATAGLHFSRGMYISVNAKYRLVYFRDSTNGGDMNPSTRSLWDQVIDSIHPNYAIEFGTTTVEENNYLVFEGQIEDPARNVLREQRVDHDSVCKICHLYSPAFGCTMCHYCINSSYFCYPARPGEDEWAKILDSHLVQKMEQKRTQKSLQCMDDELRGKILCDRDNCEFEYCFELVDCQYDCQ